MRKERKLFGISLFVALMLAMSTISFAQGLTAVTGRITDPTGAVIPGVEITVTNAATGAVRTVVSNEQGIYSATQLPPGTYNIKAELAGFKPKAANNVALPVDQIITVAQSRTLWTSQRRLKSSTRKMRSSELGLTPRKFSICR